MTQMKILRQAVLLLLLGIFGLLFTGCTTRTAQDSSIPWSRPQTWEGQIPGMGATQGSGTR